MNITTIVGARPQFIKAATGLGRVQLNLMRR
jgi:UDP-N-acetylglucosamine 2-epimerase